MVTYDGLVLAAVAAELRRTLVGGRISRVRQHNETDLTFEVRSHGANALLFASVDARFSRIYLSAANPPVPRTAPNFCMVLRKYVQGSFVRLIQQEGFDRVLSIHTEAADGNRNRLVMEIMGKHSNLILLSDSNRVLGAAKMIGRSTSRYRQILPGCDYIPPPGEKTDILQADRDEIERLWRESFGDEKPAAAQAEEWLWRTFAGFGPFLAREALLHAGEPSLERVGDEALRLRELVEAGRFSPVIHTDAEGRIDFVYPIRSVQLQGEQHERAALCEALDAYYRSAVPRWRLDRAREQVESDIRKATDARQSIAVSLQEAMLDGGKAERLQRYGEMILANLRTIARGTGEVEVTDYYDPNMAAIKIPLDPTLSPKDNAEAYFRKARRSRDAATAAVRRIEEIRGELTILHAAQGKLDALDSVDDVAALRNFLIHSHALRPTGSAAESAKPASEYPGFRIRRIISADGIEMLFGENSESNDHLTTRVARPDDVWLHARAVKGAHVVVRSGKKGLSIPSSTLVEAALLAARNSDAKHSSLVPVDYTLRKYVRKPKGAAPGLVTYSHGKTIDVTLRD